ncbi:lytic transglycosylase domain-containing protein [Ancylobacter oerskovii]|uniref:lytic transglycosylase domain-containing protein n=1 Tax=Ancylobacter oerskovii TaxID=459519 RepID=UPI001FECFF26|nr:lytic transglycosylase domain-containing protein [Ancylobacter oerskovii]
MPGSTPSRHDHALSLPIGHSRDDELASAQLFPNSWTIEASLETDFPSHFPVSFIDLERLISRMARHSLTLRTAFFTLLAFTSGINIATARPITDLKSFDEAPSFNSSFVALVDREARANGIPIALARAVVRIESNWNPGVTGSAGEVGLMQIKHPTARAMGYQGTRKALYDPETNVKWGMRYLAGAYRLAGGDTCGTVMRYQGGHGATRMSSIAVSYCSKARTIMASN